MAKEFDFLNIISSSLSDSSHLGDDCAYLDEYKLAISSDSLIEDVHFSLKYMTPYEVAVKSLLVNISDILASGAVPKYATINLSGKLDDKFISEFYKGINEIARDYNLKIIGGDLTASNKIAISITIFGDYKNRNVSSRKNARANYILAVTSEFGSSAQGLADLIEGKDNYFTQYHKKPILYPEISRAIATTAKKPYAMMDSSDGLIDCLIQISKKSNVKINADFNKIPHKTKNRDFILSGGEDYALVCALDKEDFEKIDGLIQIGTCLDGEGVFVDNEKIEYKGFNHFE